MLERTLSVMEDNASPVVFLISFQIARNLDCIPVMPLTRPDCTPLPALPAEEARESELCAISEASPSTAPPSSSPMSSTESVRPVLMAEVKAVTAEITSFAFFLMPLASSFMKSGIYSSASDSGPSSGTEKCRRLLTLLATLSAAAITELAAERTPAAIWEQMSLPHMYALDAMLLRELNLLRMSCTDEATVAFRLLMAEDTVLLTASHVAVLLLWILIQPVDTVVFTALTAVLLAVWMFVQTVVSAVLMAFHTVFVLLWMALHPEDTAVFSAPSAELLVVWILLQIVDIAVRMAFHTVLVFVWMALQLAETAVFMLASVVPDDLTVPSMT